MSGPGVPSSKTEGLRQAVAQARDGPARLAALLALARHFAEVSDGANGLETARAARTLALEVGDWHAVSHALSSATISQYHRSDYEGALATAADAWDSAGPHCQNRIFSSGFSRPGACPAMISPSSAWRFSSVSKPSSFRWGSERCLFTGSRLTRWRRENMILARRPPARREALFVARC